MDRRFSCGDEWFCFAPVIAYPGTNRPVSFYTIYLQMGEFLFSYGTLQLEKVQIESFGRILPGYKDSLSGYKLDQLEIKDEKVLQQSEQAVHPVAIPTGILSDKIHGLVFELSKEELVKADEYEVADYRRVAVRLDSGKTAWIYISAKHV